MTPLANTGAAHDPIGIAAELREIFIRHDLIGREAADALDRDAGQTPQRELETCEFRDRT